ncbi:MAG TPA: ATP synthase F1 subunit gamma [Candidatus Eisenbacteria bacterium]|nr:ATP synthase F1 subunit gamma [Candidatus Eisenbacteria bacterium]
MATLRDIRRRIRSVRSTAQITKTMEMVSAAKLRRAQTALESARPYDQELKKVLANLASASGDSLTPVFVRREVKRRALIVITSDRGLSGAFNVNLIKAAEGRLREGGAPIALVTLGRKGADYFRRRNAAVLHSNTEIGGVASWKMAEELSRDLTARFLAGEIDEVDLVFTHFKSALFRSIVIEPFLPLGRTETAETVQTLDYIFEPSPEAILEKIVPYYLAMRLYMALAESAASEHGARMVAMGSATKNANEMIQNLTLHMNRTRQATITRELVEIVAGAEALK